MHHVCPTLARQARRRRHIASAHYAPPSHPFWPGLAVVPIPFSGRSPLMASFLATVSIITSYRGCTRPMTEVVKHPHTATASMSHLGSLSHCDDDHESPADTVRRCVAKTLTHREKSEPDLIVQHHHYHHLHRDW